MNSTGRAARLAVLLAALLFVAEAALATVSASVDRGAVALGDSLRLTITATGDEDPGDTDLDPLLENFDILQRSTTSQTRYINGRSSHTRELVLDITPRSQGELQIPSLRVGSARTEPIDITVSAAPDPDTGGEAVLFEAEVDRDTVYVQGQLILTLRLMQAINLDARSVSTLELDNAFVKELEQKSFRRTIDGRPWLVQEVRYAIFPEKSGTLEIPPQVFSGREAVGRRSLFDLGGGGRPLRRVTEPLRVEVLPRPAAFPDATWLPARNVTLQETWSTPPEQLRVGESATRTLTIRGEGLQGAQLPPVLFQPVRGLKFYPDQPAIDEREVAGGLLGERRDSAAIVPTAAGTVTLPEIRIPWWDTQARELRHAVLPARTLDVAAAAPGKPADTAPSAQPVTEAGAAPAGDGDRGALPWQLLSAATTLGWAVTLLYLLRRRGSRVTARGPDAPAAERPDEKRAFRALRDACERGDAQAARSAVVDWARALTATTGPASLEQLALRLDDTEFTRAVHELDASLYGDSAGAWSGSALAAAAGRLRAVYRDCRPRPDAPFQLYPQAARGT